MTGGAADVVVVGAGLSGLTSAILLAETGRRVVVLEQHTIPGGFLQQFTRHRTRFDVGFHYLGSTRPGRPVRQFLDHLQLTPRLELAPLPADAAIEVVHGPCRWAYPTAWTRFREKAAASWPEARAALDAFADDCEAVCAAYKWFDLRRGKDYVHPLDLPFSRASLAEHLTPLGLPDWPREVLCTQSFNLGLRADEVPWTKHALAFRSNFDETSRIVGGGGALVEALVARGRELGVDYRFRQEVVGFECSKKRVRAVSTARGERWEAELFVAACHPKVVLSRIADADLKPVFKERVLALRDSRGAVQVWLRLRAPLESIGETCLLLWDDRAAAGKPPLGALLITRPDPLRLEIMTYLERDPWFTPWTGTRAFRRGPDYEVFKERLAERMIAAVARVAPELPERIEHRFAATPLTDEHYTLGPGGAVFGISHDVGQQGRDRPQPRTRLKNLWFTGHSIQMPGICGVLINAFDTCATLRGDDLFAQVAT